MYEFKVGNTECMSCYLAENDSVVSYSVNFMIYGRPGGFCGPSLEFEFRLSAGSTALETRGGSPKCPAPATASPNSAAASTARASFGGGRPVT